MPDITFTDDDFKDTKSTLDFSEDDFTPKVPKLITSLPAGLKVPTQIQRQISETGDAGMRPGTEFSSAVASDPKGFLKAIPQIAMAPFTGAGKLAYSTAADAISKIAGQPQYGGNIASMERGEDRTPAEKFIGSAAASAPGLATATKLGAQAPGFVAMAAAGGGPAWIQKLIAAGFSADMISKAPELARDLGTELGKNPGQRDQDKLTSLVADAIQTGVFAPLAGFHASRDTIMRYADKPTYLAEQVAKQLGEADFTPKADQYRGLVQRGIPTPQIPSTASQLQPSPTPQVQGPDIVQGPSPIPPQGIKRPSQLAPVVLGEGGPAAPPPINLVEQFRNLKEAQGGKILSEPEPEFSPQQPGAGWPPSRPPALGGIRPSDSPLRTAAEIKAAKQGPATVPAATTEQVLGEEESGAGFKEPSPPSEREATEQRIKDLMVARGSKGFTAPLTEFGEEGGPQGKVVFEPGGPGEKAWKATVYDEEGNIAHDESHTFLKSLIRNVHEDFGVDFSKIEEGEPAPKRELQEYKQGLPEQARAAADAILKPAIILKRDVAPHLAKLREIAAKLGIPFEEPVGGYGFGEQYRTAAAKLMAQIEKKFGTQERKTRYAGTGIKVEETGGLPVEQRKPIDPEAEKQTEIGTAQRGSPRQEGQSGREIPLTGEATAKNIGARFDGEVMGRWMFTTMDREGKPGTTFVTKSGAPLKDVIAKYEAKRAEYGDVPDQPRPLPGVRYAAGEEPPVRTAEHGLDKPMGSVTHQEIQSMPDAELIKYMEAKDETGKRFRPPHKDGINYGMKFGPELVPELEKLVKENQAKGDAAIDNGDHDAAQAAMGRVTWLNGAIEGAKKQGPNFDLEMAQRRMSVEERLQDEAERGPYGTEHADPRIVQGFRNGISIGDTLKILSETSTDSGTLAALILKHGDAEGLGVKIGRDVQAMRSYYHGPSDKIQMAGIRQYVPTLEILHEISHAMIERKIPDYMSHLERPEFRGSGYLAGLDHLISDTKVSAGIRGLAETFKRAIEAFPDKRLKEVIGDSDLTKTMGMPYGMGSLSEFISEGISRKSFQQMMDDLPGIHGKKSLWQNFVDAVRIVLGLPGKAHSLLNDFFQSYSKALGEPRLKAAESAEAARYADNPIKTFAEKDLKPVLGKAKDLVKSGADLIAKTFSPETFAKPSEADIMFESKGMKEKFLTQAAAAMDGVGKMFEKMPDKDRVGFIDRIKTGQRQPTPTLQQAADLLRTWDDKLFQAVAKFKPELPYLENHLRVLWKVIPGSDEAKANLAKGGLSAEQIASKRPWRGSQGFLRKHTLEDMSEGIALGGVPVTTNPIEMFSLHAQDAMKYVAANQAWDALKASGAAQFVKRGTQPPPGFIRIQDSIAKAYFRTPEGLISSNGEWWVNEGVGRMINNYLSRDYIRQGTESHPEIGNIGRALLALKNGTTAIELGMSPFHAVFETNEAVGSSMGLAFRKILAGQGREGFKEFAKAALVEPLGVVGVTGAKGPRGTTASIGQAAIRFAKNEAEFRANDPDTYNWFVSHYPHAKELINDLFTGGGQVKMNEEYRVKGIKGFKKAVAEDNYVGAVVRTLPAVNELMLKPLFETYIPRLKVGMFLKEYSFALQERANDLQSGKISRSDLARQSWASIEDRFGELNWDNLYWNRTFKTAAQLAFRSVTWKLGNLRAFGKAARDTVQELGVNWWKEGRAPRMTTSMGWLLGMSIVTGMQASMITKLTTGKWPWELAKEGGELMRNLVFPRIDPADPSQRVSIPTYWKDLVHAFHSPVDYVKSSMTGEIGRAMDVWNNKDFYGTEVYNEDDPWLKRQTDKLAHLIPLPFGVSSQIAAHRSGASGAKALAGYAGFTKAPYYMSYSPAELKLNEIMRDKQTIEPKTKEVFQRGVNERIAVDAIKRHEMTLGEAIEKKLVLPRRIDKVLEHSVYSHLIYSMRSPEVTPREAVSVYRLASPDEKKTLKPVIINKIINSRVIEEKERTQFLDELSKSK